MLETSWEVLSKQISSLLQARQADDIETFCALLPEFVDMIEGIQAAKLPLPTDVATLEMIESGLQQLTGFIQMQLPMLSESIHSSSNSIKLNKAYG